MDIHIQRQLSPRPGKRAGQLSSSTTIHYKWIKGKETTKTDRFADSRLTDKHHSSTEVHLLLNNKQTLWCLCANHGVADVPVKVPSSGPVTCVFDVMAIWQQDKHTWNVRCDIYIYISFT